MYTDSYFKIGKSHKVCEDYARAKEIPHPYLAKEKLPYAVVSDGCSGSEDTDFGSRLMAISVETALRNDSLSESRIMSHLRKMMPPYLPKTCLDATVLAVYPIEPGVLDVFVVGVGVAVEQGAG